MTPEMINALTPLVLQALIVVSTIVIAAIGNQVRKVTATQSNDARVDFINKVVEVGVQAAEQALGTADGQAKKEFAINFAEQWLAQHGVNVELDTLDAAIEAAVMREFNYPANVTPAVPPTDTTVTMPAGAVNVEGAAV